MLPKRQIVWGYAVALTLLTPLAAAASPLKCCAHENTFVRMETRNYWVNICGRDRPAYYMGMNKQDPPLSIRLPLRDWSSGGDYFEAVNGDYGYIVAATPRGIFLTVSRGTRELLRERVRRRWY